MTAISMIRSKRGAALSVGLFALACALCLTPAALWVLMFLYMLGCCALCTVSLKSGWLPALLCLGFSVGGMYLMMGPVAAWCTLGYLAPTWLLFLIFYWQKTRWPWAAGGMILCQVISQAAMFLILNRMAGGELFARAGELIADAMAKSDMGDMLLISMANYGFIGLSGDLADGAVLLTEMGYTLTDPARQELLLSLRSLIHSLMSALLPGMLISHSIETALLSHVWPRHCMERESMTAKSAQNETDSAPDAKNENAAAPETEAAFSFDADHLPHISKWHLPRPWGLRFGILGAGYFLASARNPAIAMLGQMFYALFTTVFSIQGLAAMNFVQHKKGTKYAWRVALPLVLTLLLPNTLMFLGIIDQVTNMRGLRPPRRRPDDAENDRYDDFNL